MRGTCGKKQPGKQTGRTPYQPLLETLLDGCGKIIPLSSGTNRIYQLFPAAALLAFGVAAPPLSSSAEAESQRRRAYVHPCPAGTEQFGGGPPDALNVMCRQPLTGGRYREHGPQIRWFSNGQKRVEGDYVRGRKHGVWTLYNRNGTKRVVEEWQNGQRVQSTRFDRSGNPIVQRDRNAERRERRQKYRWRNDMRH